MPATGVATATTTAIASLDSRLMLVYRFVAGVADVALAVASFVAVEVLKGLSTTIGNRSVIAVVGIVAVIDVTIEAMGAVKPRAGAYEEAAIKPVGTVVAVGSAVVRGVVEVSVGAHRCDSNVDRDLGRCHRSCAQ